MTRKNTTRRGGRRAPAHQEPIQLVLVPDLVAGDCGCGGPIGRNSYRCPTHWNQLSPDQQRAVRHTRPGGAR